MFGLLLFYMYNKVQALCSTVVLQQHTLACIDMTVNEEYHLMVPRSTARSAKL